MTHDRSSGQTEQSGGGLFANRAAVGIGVGLALLAGVLVATTLRRPEPPTFAPSTGGPVPTEDRLVGPRSYTVDARSPDRWQFFSFREGRVVPEPHPADWDLAFRRFQTIVNGGQGFEGEAGVVRMAGVDFDSITSAPENGYEGSGVLRGDTVTVPLKDWYSYSFFSHLLSPAPDAYALRTADGRYAKLRFLSYYCLGAQPGCVTFEYVFQGGGGRELVSAP